MRRNAPGIHAMSLTKVACALVVAATLSGCTTSSLVRTEEAREASRSSLPELPQAFATAQQNIGDVNVSWLEKLNDPLLTKLVIEAQQNNPNLQVLAANIEASRALADQAGASLSPTVGAGISTGIGGNISDSAVSKINVGLEASWELDLWGRIRSGELASEENLASVEADYLFAQYSLAANVARAYFLAIEANQLELIANSTIGVLEETHRIVTVQVENGIGDQGDLSLVKTDRANAQDSLVSSKAAQRSASRSLELLLGRYPSAELTVDSLLPIVPASPPAGLPSELLERRPDLVAAERRIAAAFNQIDAAKAAKLPALSLSGTLGGASNALSNILNPVNLAWQAASSLMAPLIDGGALDAQVDIRTAEQEAAVANYAQAALNAFNDVETSLDASQVVEQRKEALTVALDESKRALRIADLQYKEGEIGLLDVLLIQQRVFAAQRNYASINRSALIQYIDLNLALGGGWEPPAAGD
ncbi:efflux transporter outer membrane subunit [Glaciecola sp. SC05]|uniref:efflux transporter outer membrane subunit n=1 Tax=Glaciecola sp. SC05 TaxID=1987355 RepID=UPI003528582E